MSAKGTGPSALEVRGGYPSGLSDSPKFSSGDYVPSSSLGYGHKSDQLYTEKIHDYPVIDRRQYGERQSAYIGRDMQTDPAARYADSVGFSHQHQVMLVFCFFISNFCATRLFSHALVFFNSIYSNYQSFHDNSPNLSILPCTFMI